MAKNIVDKLKENFTPEQISRMATYDFPEDQVTSDQSKMAFAAEQLMKDGEFKNLDEFYNLARIVKDVDQNPDFQHLAHVAGFRGKDAEKDFADAIAHDNDESHRAEWRILLDSKYGDYGWDMALKKFKEYENEQMKEGIEQAKADAVAEFSKSPEGILSAIAFPTAYKEAVKQALTDEPMNDWKVYGAAGLDLGTAAAEAALMPNLPIVASTLGATGLEAARQGVSSATLGHDVDASDIVGTGVAAATVPTAVRGLGRLAMQAGSPTIRRLGREFMRGAKSYETDVDLEKNALKNLWLNVRRAERADQSKFSYLQSKAHQRNRAELRQKLETLGYDELGGQIPLADQVKRILLGEHPGEGMLPIGEVMNPSNALTDKQVWKNVSKAYDDAPGTIVKPGQFEEIFRNMGVNLSLTDRNGQPINAVALATKRSAERSEALANTFPALNRKGEGLPELESGWANRAARLAGHATSGIGGVAEAYAHIDPVAAVRSITEGKAGQTFRTKTEAYKNEEWFKKLKKENPTLANKLEKALKEGD